MTAIGDVSFERRYWKKCVCGQDGSYAVDRLLGIEGERHSLLLQKHCCRLGADQSFAKSQEHLHEMLGVSLSPETIRKIVEGHGKRMISFQASDSASEQAFRDASGEVEFTTDAAKVNTREEGWKDLKIAMSCKRPAGTPTSIDSFDHQRLPSITISLAFAMIASIQEFRRYWRPWLRRLGVKSMAFVHVLGDGASWIWKAANRVLTGCQQTLDFWHACERLHRCAERIYGEEGAETKAAYARGRGLLLGQGWNGLCRWVSELLQVAEEKEQMRRRKITDRLFVYFAPHRNRIDYGKRLTEGKPIGSGPIEGQAKTMGLRLKNRGARWKIGNVRAMATMVCVRNSCQWQTYWNSLAA